MPHVGSRLQRAMTSEKPDKGGEGSPLPALNEMGFDRRASAQR